MQQLRSFFIVIIIGGTMASGNTAKRDSLKTYKKKRNFSQTAEPKARIKKSSKQPIFVVQKHDSSHLHYDLRLEIDGVLVSWAVPKGPSPFSAIKRLAIMTENHPKDYATFEGVIPPGNYGAGTVMVWDIGTYKNLRNKKNEPICMRDSLHEGVIEVWLEGTKLKGGYTVIQLKKGAYKGNWLLIKMRDEYAGVKKGITQRSALTGRTLKQIAQADLG